MTAGGNAINMLVHFSNAISGNLIGCKVSRDLLLLSVSQAEGIPFDVFLLGHVTIYSLTSICLLVLH